MSDDPSPSQENHTGRDTPAPSDHTEGPSENVAKAITTPPNQPMTGTLMARLFGVPLLIVSVVVGCAVVVVLLFGSIATDKQQPVSNLLTILENSSGEKTAGVLLPQEKELWQVARELALRLSQKEKELTAEEVDEVANRLLVVLARDAAAESSLTEMGHKRFHFVIQALGLTGSPKAVEPIANLLDAPSETTRREALTSLAALGQETDVSSAMPKIYKATTDESVTVRIVACVTISSLTERGNMQAVDVLKRAMVDADREVQWNAALGLARLGSTAGRPVLLDMLSRSYWQSEVTVRNSDPARGRSEYPLPPAAIEGYLIASIQACAGLKDAEITKQIRMLTKDPSRAVRTAAEQALNGQATSEG